MRQAGWSEARRAAARVGGSRRCVTAALGLPPAHTSAQGGGVPGRPQLPICWSARPVPVPEPSISPGLCPLCRREPESADEVTRPRSPGSEEWGGACSPRQRLGLKFPGSWGRAGLTSVCLLRGRVDSPTGTGAKGFLEAAAFLAGRVSPSTPVKATEISGRTLQRRALRQVLRAAGHPSRPCLAGPPLSPCTPHRLTSSPPQTAA